MTVPFTSAPAREVLLSMKGVSKKYCADPVRGPRYVVLDTARHLLGLRLDPSLRAGEFWALRDISFEVCRGESVAIMGVNGAGKSTLLNLLLGSIRLTEGRTMTRGRIAALTEHGLGFDALSTGRENAHFSAALLGVDRRVLDRELDAIVAFAGLDAFIDAPIRTYSTGMRARLAFAIALHLAPDILLVDEILTVGDIGFQRRCIEHTRKYLERGGSLVLVSHNPHLVQSLCARCLVLDRRALVFDGDVASGVARYLDAARVGPEEVAALSLPLAAPTGTPGVPAPSNATCAANGDGVHVEDFGIESVTAGPLRTGEPARVYVRYRAAGDRGARWGFCLLTDDLSTTIVCDGCLDPIHLPDGCGELSGIIPRLPLAAGRYALRVTIVDPRTELPYGRNGLPEAPHAFLVTMPTSVRNNYRRVTKDLIVLDGVTWECRSRGAAERLDTTSPGREDRRT